MLDVLVHRGPDDCNLYADDRVQIGSALWRAKKLELWVSMFIDGDPVGSLS